MILVTGATGTTGREVLRQLRERGAACRALTRSARSARELQGAGVESAVADLADAGSLVDALAGVSAVYLVSPTSPQLAEHEANIARVAAERGVDHMVKLSVIGCSADAPIQFGSLHHGAEEAVRGSGMSSTMVRPNGFMQNALTWTKQFPAGVIRAPVVDARVSVVDVRDIAAVAVIALTDPQAHRDKAYTVTGPEALSVREQVTILREELGLELATEEISVDAFHRMLTESGVPAWTADRLADIRRMYQRGEAQDVSPDIEIALRRRPGDFRRFVADHRAAFRERTA
jgi:uncharacterized protein YbjT (DUF2867 family)